MQQPHAEKIANDVINLFRQKGGSNYAGEAITQLEHACQAAQLAELDGQDDEVILAAFLHDVGHLLEEGHEAMDGYGVKNHEGVAAGYLKELGFSERLVTLVNAHVDAKRYLCFANKRYFDNLSEASKITLQFQGGPMTEEEARDFEKNPLKTLIIKMRTWDEAAKEINVPLPDLQSYKTKIIRHLTAQSLM